ncbi:MAG: gamma-glutamylcyclotransferase [Rhodospirillaceae bacterium]|nr:MAG: gamma-glutamylcyclotransferase [Rhodospirillaceae bacterium]
MATNDPESPSSRQAADAPYCPAPAAPGDPGLDPENLWVFGYGSLMWRPGFAFVETQPARLDGFNRDMCLLSIHYRGTHDAPGLVCGLMAGGACDGRAYRIAAVNADSALAYLDARELITDIYLPRHLPIRLASGRDVIARVYVADTAHGQFVGGWSDGKKVAHIVQGRGTEGRCLEYLRNLVQHLDELGITDARMSALLRAALRAESAG